MTMTYLFNMSDIKDISFNSFYKLYPRKVGRVVAQRCFTKLNKKDKQLAYDGLLKYIRFWESSKTEKQFIPHPSTWLNQKRWEDEIDIPKQKAEFKHDATGRFFIAYCDKCKVSDFYNDYELKSDSRCCNSRLLAERK